MLICFWLRQELKESKSSFHRSYHHLSCSGPSKVYLRLILLELDLDLNLDLDSFQCLINTLHVLYSININQSKSDIV